MTGKSSYIDRIIKKYNYCLIDYHMKTGINRHMSINNADPNQKRKLSQE